MTPLRTPRHVAVVVPARNEEQHIGTCLRSVHAAVSELRRDHPHVTCEVLVVLDRCTDGTGEIAASYGVRTVRSDAGRVGTARRLGVERAQRSARRMGFAPEDVWLANTDADTEVPATWLSHQTAFAADAVDMVVGTVTPAALDAARHDRWHAGHVLAEGHSHVHGANLGLRLSTYLAVGGFADVAVHEDLDLVTRVRAMTSAWVATHRTSVLTSGRDQSRVDGGFASYIADLGDSSCAS
jgi:glycosyltransferase involved in cell wall biosynthesis